MSHRDQDREGDYEEEYDRYGRKVEYAWSEENKQWYKKTSRGCRGPRKPRHLRDSYKAKQDEEQQDPSELTWGQFKRSSDRGRNHSRSSGTRNRSRGALRRQRSRSERAESRQPPPPYKRRHGESEENDDDDSGAGSPD